MSLQSTDLALVTARVGLCRIGASRLGFAPYDVRGAGSAYPGEYVWRELKPPATQWTLATEGVVCGQRPTALFTMSGVSLPLSSGLVHYWGLGHAGPLDRGAASYEDRSPATTDEVSGIPLETTIVTGFVPGQHMRAAYNPATMGAWDVTGFSISYWFKPIDTAVDAPPDVGRAIFWTIPQYLSFMFFGKWPGHASEEGQLRIWDTDGNYVNSAGNLVGLSIAWHHMLLTYSAYDRKGRVYCDGTLFSETPALGNAYHHTPAPFTIGWEGYNRFEGYEIDDVGIWKRTLGPADAADLFAGATWPFP